MIFNANATQKNVSNSIFSQIVSTDSSQAYVHSDNHSMGGGWFTVKPSAGASLWLSSSFKRAKYVLVYCQYVRRYTDAKEAMFKHVILHGKCGKNKCEKEEAKVLSWHRVLNTWNMCLAALPLVLNQNIHNQEWEVMIFKQFKDCSWVFQLTFTSFSLLFFFLLLSDVSGIQIRTEVNKMAVSALLWSLLPL